MCVWLRECCRQVEAEVVSNSRNKLCQTTCKYYFQAQYVPFIILLAVYVYRVTHRVDENCQFLPSTCLGSRYSSYRSGLPAVVTVRNESMGGFHQRDVSPCTLLEIVWEFPLRKVATGWTGLIVFVVSLPSFLQARTMSFSSGSPPARTTSDKLPWITWT